MEERNLAKCCKLDKQIQYTQQVIVNGISQNSGEVEVPILVCPTCGHTIAQFNQGTTINQVYAACEHEISQQIKYCINCGQKLSFPTIITITAEVS